MMPAPAGRLHHGNGSSAGLSTRHCEPLHRAGAHGVGAARTQGAAHAALVPRVGGRQVAARRGSATESHAAHPHGRRAHKQCALSACSADAAHVASWRPGRRIACLGAYAQRTDGTSRVQALAGSPRRRRARRAASCGTRRARATRLRSRARARARRCTTTFTSSTTSNSSAPPACAWCAASTRRVRVRKFALSSHSTGGVMPPFGLAATR